MCNKLFPRKIEIDLKTIHQCIEKEMEKSEDLIDEKFIDFCINLIDEFNMGRNVVITEENKKESFDRNSIEFEIPQDAIEFIFRQKVISEFVRFDINKLKDEEIAEFSDDFLWLLQLVSYKYKQ